MATQYASTIGTALSEIKRIKKAKRVLKLSSGVWAIDQDVTIPKDLFVRIEKGILLNISDAISFTVYFLENLFVAQKQQVVIGLGTLALK